MNRDEFLSTQWKRYPNAPREARRLRDWRGPSANPWLVARVAKLERQRLVLRDEDREVAIAGTIFRLDGYPAHSILEPGDLIALKTSGLKALGERWYTDQPLDVLLLTPRLRHPDVIHLKSSQAFRFEEFTQIIKQTLTARGLKEVRTPTLLPFASFEPHLEPFTTELKAGRQRRTYYLPTSPELSLKKLLAHDWGDLFEIRPCFRNNELSAHHEPEFLMLEWYRNLKGLDAIAEDFSAILVDLKAKGFIGHEENITPNIQTISELFYKTTGLKITPHTDRDELYAFAVSEGLHAPVDANFDDLFHLIFLERIEKSLGVAGPDIVWGYPPSQAVLARINNNGMAERFEIYWKGFELANAFDELNDPVEARLRAATIRHGPRDEEFLRALESGLPPSSGIALGVERLYMACSGVTEIQKLRPWPTVR